MQKKQEPKPVLLTVDDDQEVLRNVARDLRKQYASKYRILAANSGREALESNSYLRPCVENPE
jgi:thioredoxin reductase (NADPH)